MPHTPIRIAKIQNKIHLTTSSAGEGVEQQELSLSAGGDATWYSHFGRQSESCETKLFSWDLAIKLLGIYLKELKTCPHKYLHMNVNSSFSHNSQNLETPRCPSVGG